MERQKPVSDEIQVHSDGGCHGNPGPGAWAFVVEMGDETHEYSGYASETTNNRMELQAVIEALTFIKKTREASSHGPDGDRFVNERPTIEIHTDSRYVQQGISSWIDTWERNGWRTSNKKAVKNQDLWQALRVLERELKPRWAWVRGHAGNPLNERCDALVQEAIHTAEK